MPEEDKPRAAVKPGAAAKPRAAAADSTAAAGKTPATELAPEPARSPQAKRRARANTGTARSTLAGRSWVSLGVTVIVIALLIVFVAENSHRVTVHFLGASGSISLALALLIAALAGAVIMLLVGSTRILQLRREIKRRL